MENLLFSITLILLASTVFTVCQTERVQDYHLSGMDEKPNLEFVLAKAQSAADAGDIEARLKLVTLRHWVQGDFETALPQLEALAADGSADAAHMLATAHMHGQGVVLDYQQAALWLERAAVLGSERAQRELAHYRSTRS